MWFGETSYEWVSVGMPFGSDRVGLGIKYLSYGSIVETDSTGLAIGNFTPSDLVIQASYAGNYSGLYWGVSLKYVSLTVKSTASAICIDIGGLQPFKLGDMNLIGGFGIYNLGFGGKFIADTFNLPFSIKAGVSGNPIKNLLVALDIVAPSDTSLYANAGAEYKDKLDTNIWGAVRCGYTLKNTSITGLTVGAGLVIDSISVDYAYIPFGDLGVTHRFSLSFAFDAGIK